MPADHQIFKKDLQKLSACANKWEIKFNIITQQCCIMQLSKHRHKSSHKSEFILNFIYSMSGHVLRTIKQHSYLVIIDHQLSWKPRIEYVCGKAKKLIGFLNSYILSYSKELKQLSYKQFMFR